MTRVKGKKGQAKGQDEWAQVKGQNKKVQVVGWNEGPRSKFATSVFRHKVNKERAMPKV